MSDLKNLPDNNDEMWEGAETSRYVPKKVEICGTHGKHTFLTHIGYVDNGDGSISCKYCGWGAILGGRYRILNEKIIDLKTLTG